MKKIYGRNKLGLPTASVVGADWQTVEEVEVIVDRETLNRVNFRKQGEWIRSLESTFVKATGGYFGRISVASERLAEIVAILWFNNHLDSHIPLMTDSLPQYSIAPSA